jgi:hypothetical protein
VDPSILEKLNALDAFEELGDGRRGVRVTLQVQARFSERDRKVRRALLRSEFEKAAAIIEPDGGKLDFDSISVSGQTAEAVLPVDVLDVLESKLTAEDVRIDALIDRQIL